VVRIHSPRPIFSAACSQVLRRLVAYGARSQTQQAPRLSECGIGYDGLIASRTTALVRWGVRRTHTDILLPRVVYENVLLDSAKIFLFGVNVPWDPACRLKSAATAAISHSKLFLSTLLVVSFVGGAIKSETPPMSSAEGSFQALVQATHEQIRKGNIVGALQNLSLIESRAGDDPEAKLAMGEMFQELAALRAEQLQKVAPESAAAHELLGKTLESQGKLEGALSEYRRALDKGPAAPGRHFLVGNVNWKLRNFDAAQAELREELKVNPHHAMANLRMGQIVLTTQRDDPMRAVTFLREAVAGAQSSLEAHRELGKALRLAHKLPEALRELQFVESKAPNDVTIHAQLAALYKETGDRERARGEIETHAKILRERLQASQKIHAERVP
jgi:tetratricopeptide (TPR) repeat protein